MSEDRDSLEMAVGRAIEGINGLRELLNERSRQAAATEDRLLAEVRNVKHDLRNSEQVTFTKIENTQLEVRNLDRRMTDLRTSTEAGLKDVMESQASMAVEIAALKPISLRRRLVTLGAILLPVGGLLWEIIKPALISIVDTVLHVH